MGDSRFLHKNGKQTGLNWAALSPRSGQVSASVDAPPSPVADVKTLEALDRKPKRGPVSAKSLANLTHRAVQRFDYQEIADLWSAGLTNKQIMAKVGCGQSTVLLALKTIRPEGYTGRSGPRPLDRCKRDHDLNVHGKPRKNGGRDCQECRRMRERGEL